MLWPIVLPFQITAVVMFVLFLGLLVLGVRRKRSANLMPAAFVLPILLFIPSCLAIGMVVDFFRFGTFHYTDFDSINDFRIERYMPPTATEITVYKHYNGNGYRARFTISKQQLDQWHQGMWEKHGEHSVMARPADDGKTESDPDEFQLWFGQFDWSLPVDAMSYQGPVAGNGAFYAIEFSRSQNLAFLRGGYW